MTIDDSTYFGIDVSLISFTNAHKSLEKKYLKYWMEETDNNQTKTAIKMGWSRGTLRSKLIKHFGQTFLEL